MKEIKSRLILPYGTPEQLAQKYAGKELSAGELLIVVNEDDGSFTLSTGAFPENNQNLLSAAPQKRLFSQGPLSAQDQLSAQLSARRGRLMLDAECIKISSDAGGEPITLTQQLCTVVNNLSVLSVVTVGTPPEEVSAAVGSLQWRINEVSSAFTQANSKFNQRTSALSSTLSTTQQVIAGTISAYSNNFNQINTKIASLSSTLSTTQQIVAGIISSYSNNFNQINTKIASLSNAITQLNTNFNQRTTTLSNNLTHALSICDSNMCAITKLNANLTSYMSNLSNTISGKYSTKQYVDQQIARAISSLNSNNNLSSH